MMTGCMASLMRRAPKRRRHSKVPPAVGNVKKAGDQSGRQSSPSGGEKAAAEMSRKLTR